MYITRSKSIIQFIARLISIVIFVVLIFAYAFGYNIENYLSIIVIILSITELVMMFYNSYIKNTGLTMIFFLYTLICHNGFVIAYFFNNDYINFRSVTSMAYVNNEYYPTAILIANIVMLFFVWATEIHTCKIPALDNYEKLSIKTYQNVRTENGSKVADCIGICAVSAGTLFLAYTVFSQGLFMGLYTEILDVTSQIPMMQHSVIITSLAIALLISAGTKRGIKVGILIYIVDMLLHFSIGNRGEVLYAAVICFALYSLRYNTIKLKHVIIAGLGVIIFIPLVRLMREGKIDLYTINPLNSFWDVLCEEGFQISPFTYIVQYVKSGHNYVWGMTYINDFADFVLRRLGLSSPWMNIEQYVIKSIMPYDGMGFSMIAELFYNFTITGPCIIYAIFARFMVWLDRKITTNDMTTKKKIFYSMLMVELINLSRNDASTLPVYLSYMIILLVMYSIVDFFLKRQSVTGLKE